jgi:hypothetical protein
VHGGTPATAAKGVKLHFFSRFNFLQMKRKLLAVMGVHTLLTVGCVLAGQDIQLGLLSLVLGVAVWGTAAAVSEGGRHESV